MLVPVCRSRALAALVLVVAAASAIGCGGLRRPKVGDGPKGDVQRGLASWYGDEFHGRATASGEIYDMNGLSAAHRVLPLGTVVEVRHLGNGRRVRVRINDRGPFIRGRIIDLSRGAAEALGMVNEGVAKVEVRVVEAAPEQPPGHAYTVQVGAFRDRDNALDLKRRLDPHFDLVAIEVGNGMHRVRIGPFAKKRDAKRAAADARARGHEAVVIALRRDR